MMSVENREDGRRMVPGASRMKVAFFLFLAFIGLAVLVMPIVAAVAPAVADATELDRRVTCMNNVRKIGLAMFQYAGDHDDSFMPLVDAAGKEVPTAYEMPTQPARTGFMVLLHQGYLTTAKVFICPSSVEEVNARFPDDFKNTELKDLRAAFGVGNCSYGWDPTKKHSVDATCAIIADYPPRKLDPEAKGKAANNSDNHLGGGQNVFYNDGHVKWGATPVPDSGDDPDIYLGGKGFEISNTDARIIR